MIILGQKYKFTNLELTRLNKKFNTIKEIHYKDEESLEVIENIKGYINKNNHEIIVLNTKIKVDEKIIKFLSQLKYEEQYKNVKFLTIEHFLEEYLYKCYIPQDNSDLHFLDDLKSFTLWQNIQKRTIDYMAVFTLLLITFPIAIYARYKIKKQSPGTSMFKQNRVGKNNKEFKCMKFRSMRLDAEKDGAKFASDDDPRIFSWGNTMRKTRIDELPQIINVLKGEMHLIGPRAEWKELTKNYEDNILYYNQRHIIAPGITGWAQVMYPYGSGVEDAKQKLMYDLYYIKHWSLWLELKVVYKTIGVVLGKKGV